MAEMLWAPERRMALMLLLLPLRSDDLHSEKQCSTSFPCTGRDKLTLDHRSALHSRLLLCDMFAHEPRANLPQRTSTRSDRRVPHVA